MFEMEVGRILGKKFSEAFAIMNNKIKYINNRI